MPRRSLVAFLMTIALAILCGNDLLTAGTRACGDHPCCTKGVCKMMPKSGERLERCGEQRAATPEVSPVVLVSQATSWRLSVDSCPLSAGVIATRAGARFSVDRPPRG